MNTETYILLGGSAALVLIGFLYYIYQITKSKRESRNIKHYEEMRDKLTVKDAEGDIKQNIAKAGGDVEEEEEEEETSSGGGGLHLGSIMGAFIAIIVGVSLIGPITSELKKAQGNLNVTSYAGNSLVLTSALLDFLPIFFGITVLLIGISVAYSALRSSGAV
jgi:hypothetical protein